MKNVSSIVSLFFAAIVFSTGCANTFQRPGSVSDEALRAGRSAPSFPAADEDYFHDMDGGDRLTADEIKGRNMWIVWTGGNDRFWDAIDQNELRRARIS